MNNLNLNPQKIINDYRTFAQGIQGNPQQIVQNMVQTGQITQQQLNMAQQLAPTIANILGIQK